MEGNRIIKSNQSKNNQEGEGNHRTNGRNSTKYDSIFKPKCRGTGFFFFFLKTKIVRLEENKQKYDVSLARDVSTYKDTERFQVKWWGKKHTKT